MRPRTTGRSSLQCSRGARRKRCLVESLPVACGDPDKQVVRATLFLFERYRLDFPSTLRAISAGTGSKRTSAVGVPTSNAACPGSAKVVAVAPSEARTGLTGNEGELRQSQLPARGGGIKAGRKAERAMPSVLRGCMMPVVSANIA